MLCRTSMSAPLAAAALAACALLVATAVRAAPTATVADELGGCRTSDPFSTTVTTALALNTAGSYTNRRAPTLVCADTTTNACRLCNGGTALVVTSQNYGFTTANFVTLTQANLRDINGATGPLSGGTAMNPTGHCLHVPSGQSIIGDLELSGGADCLIIEGSFVGKIKAKTGNDVVLVQSSNGGAADPINNGGALRGALDLGEGDDCMFTVDAAITASLEGGLGADTFQFTESRVRGVVDGGEGTDVFYLGQQSNAATRLTRYGLFDAIVGGPGSDIVVAFDVIVGLLDMGSGNDEVVLQMSHANSVELGDGNDRFEVLSVYAPSGALNDEFTINNRALGFASVNVLDGGAGDDCLGAHGGFIGGAGAAIGKVLAGAGSDQLVLSAGAVADGPIKLRDGDDAVGVIGSLINGHVFGGRGVENFHMGELSTPVVDSGAKVNGDIIMLPDSTNHFVVTSSAVQSYHYVNGEVRTGRSAINNCNIAQNTDAANSKEVFIRDGVTGCAGSSTTGYILP